MTGDLVERLRQVLAERERGIPRREVDAELRAEPRERWEQHHYAAAERLERLRTIQAHRKILDEHTPALDTVEWPHDQNGRGEAWVCPRCQNADHDVLPTFPLGAAGVLPEGFTAPYVLAPCDTLRALASIYFPEGTEP